MTLWHAGAEVALLWTSVRCSICLRAGLSRPSRALNFDVTQPLLDAQEPAARTGPAGSTIDFSPISGIRYGVGGQDENSLRMQLRIRAMAMAEGQSQDGIAHVAEHVRHVSLRHEDRRSLSPTVPPVPSANRGPIPLHLSNLGCSTAVDSPSGHPPTVQSVTPQCAAVNSEGVALHETHTPATDYILNRLVPAIEAGAVEGEGLSSLARGGVGTPPSSSHHHTSLIPVTPQQPRCGQATTPPAGHTASQAQRSDGGEGGGLSTEGTKERGKVWQVDAPKNTERGREDETTVLCRGRNEMKEVMGDDTEAMGRVREKAGFWKMVADRMWEKGFNCDEEQCKGMFHQALGFYRRLKIHEKWSPKLLGHVTRSARDTMWILFRGSRDMTPSTRWRRIPTQ
ncbi:hypothetical protein CBR_g39171 [Chara braunii]|uniref:C2H2-type domain-containing protein n=1 Tax=Chara braunii TaxID=69332 RepID=A0A388LRA9_CHABU|nr:hypothetical protein CBR_g39171 [Chara braunii]|eukprot:GBG84795.1 hypothetical protein CBR_g39171 [Chara braunii]